MITWGPEDGGVRFGLRAPQGEMEAGGTVHLELICENGSGDEIEVFGFRPDYPRSLRVSPPKVARPYIRVSFGDVNVLHPREAFVTIRPGQSCSTTLDLSFAFDRRGAGRWPITFAYDAVRAGGRARPWLPRGQAPEASIVDLLVTSARSLRDAGIDERAEAALDAALLGGRGDVAGVLRQYPKGGAIFAARRVARILSSGTEASLGWRALDALSLLKEQSVPAIVQARAELPHAEPALAFAEDWLRHRAGEPPRRHSLPFVDTLDRIIKQPDSRGNFLLSWTATDSPVHGTRRLQLLGSGERIVTIRLPGQTVARTQRYSLTSMQMDMVGEALRYAAIWLMRPLRAVGLPDEPRPTLEVQLALGDPFVHSVAMWNGEWRMGPASALADLLDRLSDVDPSRKSTIPLPSA